MSDGNSYYAGYTQEVERNYYGNDQGGNNNGGGANNNAQGGNNNAGGGNNNGGGGNNNKDGGNNNKGGGKDDKQGGKNQKGPNSTDQTGFDITTYSVPKTKNFQEETLAFVVLLVLLLLPTVKLLQKFRKSKKLERKQNRRKSYQYVAPTLSKKDIGTEVELIRNAGSLVTIGEPNDFARVGTGVEQKNLDNTGIDGKPNSLTRVGTGVVDTTGTDIEANNFGNPGTDMKQDNFGKPGTDVELNNVGALGTDVESNTLGNPGSNDEQNYFELRWSELPESAKTAARTLGYNQTKWDMDAPPEVLSTLKWEYLPQIQQSALLQLGTNQEEWNETIQDWNNVGPDASTPKKRKRGFFRLLRGRPFRRVGRFFRRRRRTTKMVTKPPSVPGPKPEDVQVDSEFEFHLNTTPPQLAPDVHEPQDAPKGRDFPVLFVPPIEAPSLEEPQGVAAIEAPKQSPTLEAPRDIPVVEVFQDEPEDVEESCGDDDELEKPLLSEEKESCNGCTSMAEVPEMTDLLDDIHVGDELEELVRSPDEANSLDESVPLVYSSSFQHVGLFGRRNFLLGRSSRGIATTTKSAIDASPLLDTSLIDSEDDNIKTTIHSNLGGETLLEDDEDGEDLPYYDNYDWSELPRAAKTAAITLGYNKKMWNKGKEPEDLSEYGWDDLDITQQAAALELGWDKARWDGIPKDGKVVNREESLLNHVRDEVYGGWRMASSVLAFDSRSRRLLNLALPATVANCLSPILEGVLIAVFVTYMGPSKYLAWVMVSFFLGLCDSIVAGVSEAEGILTAQAIGMGKYALAGQYVQLSVLLYFIVAIPTYGSLVFFIGDLMKALGFGDVVANDASLFVPYAAASNMIHGCFGSAIEGLMWNEERGVAMTVLSLVNYSLYTGAFMIMVFLFDCASMQILGAIDLGFAVFYSIAVYAICKFCGWLQKYESGLFSKFSLSNWTLTVGVLKMAAPLTLGHIVLSVEWQCLTLFAAHLGAAETAAWSIAASLWGILENVPSGVHHGSEILIGRYLGLGRPDLAKIVAYKSMFYSFLIAAIATGVFAVFREQIILYFTEVESLYYLVLNLVSLMCISNVVMAIGNAAYSILETQGRTKVPVAIYGFSMTFITLPLSAWLVLGENHGLESIMMSSIYGYSVSSFLMVVVVLTTNWPKMSRKSILKAAKYEKGSNKGTVEKTKGGEAC